MRSSGRRGRGPGPSGAGPLAAHQLAHCRGDLLAERGDRGGVVAGEDEGADAVLQGERGELVHPLPYRADEQLLAAAVGELSADVQQPPDLARVAARVLSGSVD